MAAPRQAHVLSLALLFLLNCNIIAAFLPLSGSLLPSFGRHHPGRRLRAGGDAAAAAAAVPVAAVPVAAVAVVPVAVVPATTPAAAPTVAAVTLPGVTFKEDDKAAAATTTAQPTTAPSPSPTHIPPPSTSYFTPLDARLRGQSYTGSATRLRAALQRALDGEQITVGLIGGSIAAGAGSWHVGNKSVSGWLETYFQTAFPKAPPRMVNGAVGATTTSYMAVCASHHVPEQADVVITEYAVNNRNFWEAGTEFDTPLTRSYERLMRWVLRLPRAPAVVMLDMFNWRDGWPFRGAYWGGSVERDTRELSLFYDAPSLSVKGSVYHLMVGNASGYRVDNFVKNLPPAAPAEQQRDYFFYDSIHPSGHTGHRVMAELVIELFEQTIAGLRARPLSDAERAATRAPLPPPMLPDNEALPTVCYTADGFKGLVTGVEGFEWRDEARKDARQPKLGFIATEPGAALTLRLDTSALKPPSNPDWGTVVKLAHLKSYQHMGAADVTCVRGCKCEPTQFNGHHEVHNSQVHHHSFVIELGGDECVLRVAVADITSSGEHKVKVTGVIVHEDRRKASYLARPVLASTPSPSN